VSGLRRSIRVRNVSIDIARLRFPVRCGTSLNHFFGSAWERNADSARACGNTVGGYGSSQYDTDTPERGRPVSTSSVTVTGMTCNHCVSSVTEEISALPGVTSVNVDLATGEVVIGSTTDLDPGAVAEAVAEAGYSVAG
jgi:copper chaperone